MTKTSVNLKTPSPYIEKTSFLYKLKRKLTYAFAIRAISKFKNKRDKFSILEIGTGSGYFLSFIHSEFPNATLFGIEYDPRLFKETKKKVPFANLSIGNAEFFSFVDQKFDDGITKKMLVCACCARGNHFLHMNTVVYLLGIAKYGIFPKGMAELATQINKPCFTN